VVHAQKGPLAGPFFLDGRSVPVITAYLFHAGWSDNPALLQANTNKSFQGSILLGMGFTFDSEANDCAANSEVLMHELIAKDSRNTQIIRPFIGWEEVANSPIHAHRRYAIDFFDKPLDEAAAWPDLLEIVRRKVKPERDHQKRDANRDRWWQYAEKRPGLYRSIASCRRVLVTASQAMTQYAFALLPSGMIYSSNLNVFPLESYSAFCTIQCRVHEAWARFQGSTLKDDLAYTPSDCFETYPFTSDFESDPKLESAGQAYHDFRAALMVRNNEGLTKTYNRFHDADERSPDILKLRELHAAMDRAVLDAYGWIDLMPTCEFLLDYEEDEDEDESGGGRRRKKPWRYRWPDDFRDEVLARLLELNRQRAEEERLSGAAAESTASPKRARKVPREKPSDQPEMF